MEGTTKRIIIQLAIVFLVILLMIVLFFTGIFIGYVFLGKGNASDAFSPETWNHILDFIK
ncbi:MAG: DNA-directed RNA polymerase subunit beta [Vagococcus sp.]